MSFQYIVYRYTAGPSGGPPQDVVICTDGLEEDMKPWLDGISQRKTPDHAGLLGPQYAYRIHRFQERDYHVLSCVRRIKDERTQAKGHMAHHFILTSEEVAALTAGSSAPTPAGLMLAYEKCEIWQTGTPGEHPDVNSEPETSESDIPDASEQVTWRKFTGRDDYARALLTPPYTKECLVMLPVPTDVRDVLMLLHESDWLTPTYGWGRTFATHGTVQDDIKATQRIAIPIGSLLPIEESWSRIPRLCINERLDLDKTDDDVPFGAESAQRTTTQGQRKRISPENPVPYRYVEEDDNQMFNVPFRDITPLLRYGGMLALLLVITVSLYSLLHAIAEQTHPTAPVVQHDPPAQAKDKKQPKPSHQARVKNRMALYHGHPVPDELTQLLTSTGGSVTLQQPSLKGARIKGVVQSTEPSENGILLHIQDKNGTRHQAEVIWLEGYFYACCVNGEKMVLHLTADDCEIVLVPMIRLELPQGGKTPLPDIRFDIKPTDLHLVNGRLYCTTSPELEKPVPVVWGKTPHIDMPFFPGPSHVITCHAEPDVPYQIDFGPMLQKMNIKRLSLAFSRPNPYKQIFLKDFDIQANTQYVPGNAGSTLAHLYELAEQMKEGHFTPGLESEYQSLRELFHRDLRLPDYEEKEECGQEIETALCDKFSRDIQNCYERMQEGDKTLREALVLELNSVYFIDNGSGVHWVFVLYNDATTTTTGQLPQ